MFTSDAGRQPEHTDIQFTFHVRNALRFTDFSRHICDGLSDVRFFFAASYRRFFTVNATDIYDSVNPMWQGNSKKRENLLRTAVIRPGTCGYHIHLLSLWFGLLFFADKLIELFLSGQPVPQCIFHKFWIKKKSFKQIITNRSTVAVSLIRCNHTLSWPLGFE